MAKKEVITSQVWEQFDKDSQFKNPNFDERKVTEAMWQDVAKHQGVWDKK